LRARTETLRYDVVVVKRLVVYAALLAFFAATAGACDEAYVYGVGPREGRYCRQFDTCGACTPVLGCGWCTSPDGTGTCTSDPDECPTEQFDWTWNPSGCLVPADASVSLPARDGGEVGDETAPVDDASSEAEASPSPCASADGAPFDGGCD
jgi:hypothetical protein